MKVIVFKVKNIINNNIVLVIFLIVTTLCFSLSGNAIADDTDPENPWTIYFRPGLRFGTDSRTLYVMDFLVPLYQDDRNILYANTKFTPNDHDGWELNLGLGYRYEIIDNHLIMGVNGFYDKRRTPWGTKHDQWGIGAELMGEVPFDTWSLGLTGRYNYYHPISDAHIDIGPNGGYVYRGNGIYTLDNIWFDEPLGGMDGEIGVRIPFVSDYVETWVYGGAYHFEGDNTEDIDGFSTRVEVYPTDFLKLAYEYREDDYYGGDHYGEVMVEVPFSIENLVAGKNPFEGLGDRLGGTREFDERMVETPRRDVDVKMAHYGGKDAAEKLGKKYRMHTNKPYTEFDINDLDLNSLIMGNIIFVSEAAELKPDMTYLDNNIR